MLSKAVLSFENQASAHLNEEDFINILAHKKHKATWTDPDNEAIWLAVHYRSNYLTKNQAAEPGRKSRYPGLSAETLVTA